MSTHLAETRRRRGGRGETSMVPELTPQSYYGRPVLKKPVWIPEIAVYFLAGGIAGGSTLVAKAARRRGNQVLADRALFTALGALAVSPPLLIRDLGRPERFHHMLRVFKVTSPMSVGTWLLTAAGASTGTAAACRVLGRLPRLQRAAETAAAVTGPGVATYTAVLIANTAIPVWHQARHELPFVFAASAVASTGATLTLVTPAEHAAPARTLAVLGVAGSMAALEVMERRLGETAEPYRRDEAGRFTTAARLLSGGGAAAVLLGGRRRRRLTAVGAAAVLAGAMGERYAIFRAGPDSLAAGG